MSSTKILKKAKDMSQEEFTEIADSIAGICEKTENIEDDEERLGIRTETIINMLENLMGIGEKK